MSRHGNLSARLQRLMSDAEDIRLASSSLPSHEDEYLALGQSLELLNETIDLEDNGVGLGDALARYSRLLSSRNHLSSAINAAERSVEVYSKFEDTGDQNTKFSLSQSLVLASKLHAQTSKNKKARAYAERAVSVVQSVEDTSDESYLVNLALALENCANQAHANGDNNAAQENIEKAIEVYKRVGDQGSWAHYKDTSHALQSLADFTDDADLAERARIEAGKYFEMFDEKFEESLAARSDQASTVTDYLEKSEIFISFSDDNGALTSSTLIPAENHRISNSEIRLRSTLREELSDITSSLPDMAARFSNRNPSIVQEIYRAANQLQSILSDDVSDDGALVGWLATQRLSTILQKDSIRLEDDVLLPLESELRIEIERFVSLSSVFFLSFESIRHFQERASLYGKDKPDQQEALAAKEILAQAVETEILSDALSSAAEALIDEQALLKSSFNDSRVNLSSVAFAKNIVLASVGAVLAAGGVSVGVAEHSKFMNFLNRISLDVGELGGSDEKAISGLVTWARKRFGR